MNKTIKRLKDIHDYALHYKTPDLVSGVWVSLLTITSILMVFALMSLIGIYPYLGLSAVGYGLWKAYRYVVDSYDKSKVDDDL